MPQNFLWLVKWSDRYWEPAIHPQGQPPSRAGRGRAIQPGKPHGDRLQGGEAVTALADMPGSDTLGVPMLDGGEDPAPAVVHREHPNAHRWPAHEPFEGACRDDTHRHGDTPPRRRQRWGESRRVLAHQAEHPLAGNNPDVATDPKPSPDLAVALATPRAMPRGRLRSPPAGLPGPRSRASVPDAIAGGCSACWPRGHGVERGYGPCPRRLQTRRRP